MQSTATPIAAPAPGKDASGAGHGKKIADIERLRGVAILLVVFVHLPFSVFLFARAGLDPLRRPCWLGVHLFFVISGYVVMKSFTSSRLSIWKFYVRRVFRLWPVLLSFFAFSALVNCLPTVVTIGWKEWAKNVPPIMLAYYTVHLLQGRPLVFYNQAMWSLSVEEQFYLVAPAVIVLLWYLCRGRAHICGRVFVGLYVAIAVVLRLTLAYDVALGLNARQWIPWPIQYITVWQFDFITLGVILYFRSQRPNALLARMGVPLQRVLAWGCVALPFLVMYPLGGGIFFPWDQRGLYPFGLMAAGLGFYGAVALAALDKNLLYTGRWLDRFVMYWGTRSYGIYVFHYPIIGITFWLAPQRSSFAFFQAHPVTYEALRAVLVMLIGLPVIEMLYRYIEQPGINLGRRLIQRLSGDDRKRTPPGTQPAPLPRAA